MGKNECLFSFGKINKYFIIPFLCPIFLFLTNYFIILYISNYRLEKEINDDKFYTEFFKKKSYLLSSVAFLSHFIGGFLYFISYIRTGTHNRESKVNNSLKIFFILFAMSLLLCYSELFILYFFNKNFIEIDFYYFIFFPIFSKLILKNEFYRHQILSLFLTLIGLFLLLNPYASIQSSEIIFNILKVITSACDSFVYVIFKKLTDKYFLSPYLCLLFIGFFSLIILFVGFIIFYLISDKNLDNFIYNFRDESFTSVIYLILFLIFCSILYV